MNCLPCLCFKILEQLLCALILVPSSFVDFDAYFKALIHFLKKHFGKVLFSHELVQCFFLRLCLVLLVFYPFC